MMWACAQTKNGRLKRPDCARAAAARCCPRCVASRHPCPPLPAARRIFARSSWSTPSPDSLTRRTTQHSQSHDTAPAVLRRLATCSVPCRGCEHAWSFAQKRGTPRQQPSQCPSRAACHCVPRFPRCTACARPVRGGAYSGASESTGRGACEGDMPRRRAVSMPIDRPTCARDT